MRASLVPRCDSSACPTVSYRHYLCTLTERALSLYFFSFTRGSDCRQYAVASEVVSNSAKAKIVDMYRGRHDGSMSVRAFSLKGAAIGGTSIHCVLPGERRGNEEGWVGRGAAQRTEATTELADTGGFLRRGLGSNRKDAGSVSGTYGCPQREVHPTGSSPPF